MHTVYIVDDDGLAIDKYLARSSLFMESGFEIIGTATDPFKALSDIRELCPDAVISDLKMPGLSGTELFDKLRCDDSTPLFVIVSAYDEFKDVRKFFLTYGFDYLLKPVEDNELVDLLNRLSANIASDHTWDSSGQPPRKRLEEIIAFIKESPHMHHTLESISERFCINPTGICNMFSRYLNTTFSSYITALRMERAKELLLTTFKPIKEIAVICGYTDALYFTRVFNKTCNMSPSRFRETEGGLSQPDGMGLRA